jgi:branched-chain amino acid transport system permease protein
MERFILQFINGITYAGLLFIIASGFTLLFGVMRVVNMSHGVFYILGAYVGYSIQKQTGNWLFAVLAGTVTVGITAFVFTLGFAMMIGDLCLYIWGGLPRTIKEPHFTEMSITLLNLTYPGFRIFALALSVVIGIGMWLMLRYTQLGRILRAGVDNQRMVNALGINIDRIFTLVFVLTGIITGLSGTIGGTYIAFGPRTDYIILTYALVVVIMGGFGSIAGSALGAVIVGLVDSFGRSNIHEVAVFLLMGTLILVLAFRPRGLLGKEE